MSDSKSHELSDEQQAEFHYGKGGVPWYLLLFYISFLTFFTWYVLEFQLPEFLAESPMGAPAAVEAPVE